MKNIKIIALAVLIGAISYSCNKIKQIDPDIPDPEGNTMKDLVVPDGFNWQTITDYNFNITGGSGEVIRITSEDESLIYHKGTYIEENGKYKVELRLPSFLTTVKINSVSVDLVGGNVNYDLSTKAGLVNHTLKFNGSNNYVNLGNLPLNVVDKFTIECKVYDNNNMDDDYIFSKSVDVDHDIRIRTSGGAMIVEIGDGSDTYATWAGYSAAIPTPQWFHLAVVYDGFTGTLNSDKLKLYIDGSLITSLSFTGNVPANTADLALKNAILSSSLGFFDGYMDELRVWNDVRTLTEINAFKGIKIIYPNADASLIAYYRMDSNAGDILVDDQGNYNGTIFGTPVVWGVFTDGWDSDGDGIVDADDDYWDDPLRAHDIYYPNNGTMGTVAFEDLWPGTGDYDFNDLVIGYQFRTVTGVDNYVREIRAYFEVRAHGAALNNAFGFQLPGASSGILTNVIMTGYSHTTIPPLVDINGTTHFETGQFYPVIIVMDQVSDLMPQFQNTESWKPTLPYVPITITLTVPLGFNFLETDFDMQNWDPFMIIGQDRDIEVHLIDKKHTDMADPSYLGTVDDASVSGDGKFYRTATGLPWVLEFPTAFEWPREKVDITWAYYHFKAWAEGDENYNDWYSSHAPGYRLDSNIY